MKSKKKDTYGDKRFEKPSIPQWGGGAIAFCMLLAKQYI